MAEPFLNIIVQYCNDPRMDRQAEYDECVRRNLAHPAVKSLHNLVEEKTAVPGEFREHPKYVEKRVERWLTYADALAYASEGLANEIVGILNLDIFLDPSQDWTPVRSFFQKNPHMVLCQSRVEFDPNGAAYKDPDLDRLAFCNSQDAWFFMSPLVAPECDFEIGTLGCDNAFAERIKRGGRTPLNAADQYRIFHYDRARKKNFLNQAQVHVADRGMDRFTRHPNREGYYFLPNCDQVKSVDQLMQQLKLNALDRYIIICDIMTKYLRADND